MNELCSPITNRFPEDKNLSMIAEALKAVGEFGRVELIVERGKLRYIVLEKSFDVNKWQPGVFEKKTLVID
jgi:hypothetical protein